jgi:diguanylate cyclase (GGDEF)-like protein
MVGRKTASSCLLLFDSLGVDACPRWITLVGVPINRPVVPNPSEMVAALDADRFILLKPDGTVVWENPQGWAAGAHLASFLHPSGRRLLDEAVGLVLGGRIPAREFSCEVVGADREWRRCCVEVSAAPREYADAVFVTLREERSDAETGGGDRREGQDTLTALANREAVLACFREAAAGEETSRSLAVLYIDIDHFKKVNDRLGHAGGDAVLLAVADRLRAAVRPGDLVSRFGGDEFVVVARGVDDLSAAAVIAERVRSGMGAPVRASGRTINVTLSVGAAVGDGREGEALLQQADTALYRAKEQGRDRAEMYRPGDRIRGTRQTGSDAALAGALEKGQIGVVYEPVVDLVSGAPVMMRVSLGASGPDGAEHAEELLKLADDSGFLVSLGAGMLDQACDAASTWPADVHGRPTVGLVWPMTERQLEESRAADQVLTTLAAHRAPASWLMVEVPEDSLANPGPSVLRTLDQLQAGGVRLMLGGFGAGSAGLATVRRFSLDALVLDESFLDGFGEDPRQTRFMTAVLGFGRLLEVGLAVRGVRTEAEATLLRALGCNWAAGPYFGSPEPLARIGPRPVFGE